MKNRLENAYAEFSLIAGSPMCHDRKVEALRSLYERMGSFSDELDNMIYRSLGLSADDVIDMLDAGDVLA